MCNCIEDVAKKLKEKMEDSELEFYNKLQKAGCSKADGLKGRKVNYT